MSDIRRSDLRLAIRALREGWPVTDVQRAAMHADAIEATLTGSERLREAGKALLAALEAGVTK